MNLVDKFRQARRTHQLCAAVAVIVVLGIVTEGPNSPTAPLLMRLSAGQGTGVAGADPTTTTVVPADAPVNGPTASNSGTAPKSPYWGTPVQWDNFNGTSLNSTEWYVYDSPSSTPSRSASSTSVSDGFLNLAGVWDAKTKNHTSGGTSWNLGRGTYGRWEIRMRADAGAGFSPTVLLWPDSEVWPRDGEIDIFEGGPWPDRMGGMSGVHNAQPLWTQRHVHYKADATDWHTYGVDWTPEKLSFYIDGKVVHTEDNPRYIPSSSSMHIALQNDTVCGWAPCPDGDTQPITNMQVDYVAMFANDFTK